MQKYFPIQVDPACQLKWAWSTIRLYDGKTASCHRVGFDSININNFDRFHNTPRKINERELMLAGQWPIGGCDYCKNIEDAGGTSDRMMHKTIPNLSPEVLFTDPTAVNIDPTIVEVYFDNVCNLKCLYCWDGFSSKIQYENNLHGRFEQDGVIIDNLATSVPALGQLTEKFWEWMRTNGKSLKRFHFLGGEPFHQTQLDQAIDFFELNPCPDIEFNIISNLSVPSNNLEEKILKIKALVASRKIKRFDLTASLDCFGDNQAYVRYGIDIELWKKNFEWLAAQKWITLNVNQTFSCLTISNADKLVEWVHKFNRHIGHYFTLVVHTYSFLHPKIFGPNFFNKEIEKIIAVMYDNNKHEHALVEYMQGILKELNVSHRDQAEINKLVIFLNEIDRRRGTNWRQTFPWLEKEVNNVV